MTWGHYCQSHQQSIEIGCVHKGLERKIENRPIAHNCDQGPIRAIKLQLKLNFENQTALGRKKVTQIQQSHFSLKIGVDLVAAISYAQGVECHALLWHIIDKHFVICILHFVKED